MLLSDQESLILKEIGNAIRKMERRQLIFILNILVGEKFNPTPKSDHTSEFILESLWSGKNFTVSPCMNGDGRVTD